MVSQKLDENNGKNVGGLKMIEASLKVLLVALGAGTFLGCFTAWYFYAEFKAAQLELQRCREELTYLTSDAGRWRTVRQTLSRRG